MFPEGRLHHHGYNSPRNLSPTLITTCGTMYRDFLNINVPFEEFAMSDDNVETSEELSEGEIIINSQGTDQR